MTNPSDDFIKLVASDLISGKRFTPAIKEQFTTITTKAFQQLISGKINERLKVAMAPEIIQQSDKQKEPSKDNDKTQEENEIITTAEEWEGFFTVRAILREIIDPKRILMRDALSYCAILFDDNNRKPVCRLRFNNPSRLVIGLFKENNEERVQIPNVDAIYEYADRLKETIANYLNEPEKSSKKIKQEPQEL